MDAIYVIDSLPIAVCDNIRIKRSKLYPDAKFRGFIPSKKRWTKRIEDAPTESTIAANIERGFCPKSHFTAHE